MTNALWLERLGAGGRGQPAERNADQGRQGRWARAGCAGLLCTASSSRGPWAPGFSGRSVSRSHELAAKGESGPLSLRSVQQGDRGELGGRHSTVGERPSGRVLEQVL